MLDTPSNRPALPAEIARRRTFAIISHPDAGKTTLTEKFLLFGGAIQMAGQVRAKGEARPLDEVEGSDPARVDVGSKVLVLADQ